MKIRTVYVKATETSGEKITAIASNERDSLTLPFPYSEGLRGMEAHAFVAAQLAANLGKGVAPDDLTLVRQNARGYTFATD